jgi:hypothetical protein
MTSIKLRRKKIYLGGMLQTRLVTRLGIYWVLYHVVLWHALFLMRYFEYQQAFFNGEASMTFGELYGSFAWQNRSMAIAAAAFGPFLLWDVIRMTHRVAGPIKRVEGTLLRMASGEKVSAIKFRKGDWVPVLEKAFNEYLKSLEGSPARSDTARVSASTETRNSAIAARSGEIRNIADPAGLVFPEEVDALLHDATELAQLAASRSVSENCRPNASP